jgi:glycosidase
VGVLIENGASEWEDQPETHELLAEIATLVNSYGKRYLVCEAPSDPPAYARADSCGRAFAFQASAAILDSARSGTVSDWLVDVLRNERIDHMPLFLSNHDRFAGDRVWNQLDGDVDAYRLAAATYMLAARNPFTYYGEEIGMSGAAALGGDSAIRTPMSWNADPLAAGFSTVTPFRALADNYAARNVERQSHDAESLLEHYRRLYALRNAHPVLGSGVIDVQSGGGEPVLVLARNEGGTSLIVAINYGTSTELVQAASPLADTLFKAAFGALDNVTSNGAGDLLFDVAPKSAVVYVSTP